jgi:integrase/recombinase XerD
LRTAPMILCFGVPNWFERSIAMTELRQKMLEDLKLRNYSPNTIEVYIRCVARFARYFGASPDRLGPEHIRKYQLFLVQQKKLSWSLFNQNVCALRFFYHHTLHKDWMIEHIPYPRHEQKLPVVLSPSEVAALFQVIQNLKHRAILMTIYATGLRVSEVTNLRVTDIDSQRQLIRVRQGKGHKDRYVMLSPKLLDLLRAYWKSYRPTPWLFAGESPERPFTRESSSVASFSMSCPVALLRSATLASSPTAAGRRTFRCAAHCCRQRPNRRCPAPAGIRLRRNSQPSHLTAVPSVNWDA